MKAIKRLSEELSQARKFSFTRARLKGLAWREETEMEKNLKLNKSTSQNEGQLVAIKMTSLQALLFSFFLSFFLSPSLSLSFSLFLSPSEKEDEDKEGRSSPKP